MMFHIVLRNKFKQILILSFQRVSHYFTVLTLAMAPTRCVLQGALAQARGGALYPRESETREVKSLDGIWNFRLSPQDPEFGFKNFWYKSDLDKVIKYFCLFFAKNKWSVRQKAVFHERFASLAEAHTKTLIDVCSYVIDFFGRYKLMQIDEAYSK